MRPFKVYGATTSVLVWLVLCASVASAAAPSHRPRQRSQMNLASASRLGPRAGLLGPNLAEPVPTGPAASGYADSFLGLKEQVREYERDPANRYTYCIRATATYECLSYAASGQVRRQQSRAVAHGTGFAYRQQDGATYLLTNAHVASWPAVTDATHKVDDVPAGCKLVSDTLKIVDNDDDDYAADDIPLTRVVVDDVFDTAVVEAHARLRLMPYHVGRSDALKVGDVVMVRGFPLGAFQAYNIGTVVNTHDHDDYRDWDHIDFIIDAPLSAGNSGSPVLALSRRTGEYELVGVFHASYVRANALNAVIAIDQIRDLMESPGRPRAAVARHKEGPAQRAELVAALDQQGFVPYLTLGTLTVGVRRAGDGLLFEVFSRHFPLDDRRLAVLEDRPAEGAFGTLATVWFGNERGLKEYAPAELEGDTQQQLQAVLHRLQGLVLATTQYRSLNERAASSREAGTARAALLRSLSREAGGDQDLALGLLDLADRLSPRATDQPVSYRDLLAGALSPVRGLASTH